MTSISFVFESILLSALLVLVLVRLGIQLARRLRLLDIPKSEPHKQHSAPTPLAGGIVLIIALILSGVVFRTYRSTDVVAIFLACLIVFGFGLWDDFKRISPLIKLIGQFLAVLLLIRMGVSIRIFESPEFFLKGQGPITIYLDWFITVFWVIGVTNAFNFVDSMDGLAVGLGGTAAAFFMLVTLDARQPILSRESALILGVCIGLYFFNAYPAQLFLGDSGAQTLGFILAGLAIAYTPKGANQSSSWLVPIMLLGVPIFDTTLVVLSRLRRKKPVYTAALDHTYHRLLSLGWNSTRSVLIMQVAALLLGCMAFLILTRPPWMANGVFIAVIISGALAFRYLDDKKRWP